MERTWPRMKVPRSSLPFSESFRPQLDGDRLQTTHYRIHRLRCLCRTLWDERYRRCCRLAKCLVNMASETGLQCALRMQKCCTSCCQNPLGLQCPRACGSKRQTRELGIPCREFTGQRVSGKHRISADYRKTLRCRRQNDGRALVHVFEPTRGETKLYSLLCDSKHSASCLGACVLSWPVARLR